MISNYTLIGAPLLSDPATKGTAQFVLENTNTTIANTLRRCILTMTRSAGFMADLTNAANPGIVIRKNTSVIFNEMLAHRITLLPLGVVQLDSFDPTRYECVLTVKNTSKGSITSSTVRHVTASDFVVREKQADGSFVDLPTPAVAALFPVDTITKQASLLLTLRPQWNPEQPAEEIDLTAYPVIGTGREFIGFSPVSQCSYENTRDDDPVRQEEFFAEWVATYKKVADMTALTPEQRDIFHKEWMTMAVQRCFKVGPDNQPNSFTFTVESVGIRPVRDIVTEGIDSVVKLCSPYTDPARPMAELGLSAQPVGSRMKGINLVFEDQEHTLGNLLQTLMTEMYVDAEAPESPVVYVGYKVRHPLHRSMTLTVGIRDGVPGDPVAIARQAVADAANRAITIFSDIKRNWEAVAGGSGASVGVAGGGGGGAAAPVAE
jgi:DNA-directed RNA polymerase subunit L